MNRPLPLTLAVALALGSSAAHALGLGGINVKSELNEPLRAEIPVYVSAPAEAESLRVELAAAAEFARVGLDIGDLGVPLEFEVGKNARGEPVILVMSNQAIREPTLTFLVEVNWSNGRFLREYSVLLDPPVTVPVSAPAAPASTSAPVASVEPIADPVAVEPTPIAEPEPLPEAPLSTPEVVEAPATSVEPTPAEPVAAEPEPTTVPSDAPTPEAATPEEPATPEEAPTEPVAEAPPAVEPEPIATPTAPSASEYGPIASGETLWEISNTTRPAAITPSQMMLALLRANPDAFFRDNVNALKRGAILRIPGEADLRALAAAEAASEILSQNQSWIEATRPTTVADASVESSTTRPSTTTSSTRPGSRLELVPPAAGQSGSDRPGAPGGTGDSAAVRAELARAREALTSTQQDVGELRSRVKALEDLKTSNERLLTLKDNELKNLRDKLAAAERAAAIAAAAKPAPATTPDPVPTPVVTAPPAAVATAPTTEPVATDPLATESPTDAAAATTEPTTGPAITTDAADPLASADQVAADPTAEPAEVTPIADAEPVAVGEPVTPSEPWYAAPMIKYILGGIGLLVVGLLGFLFMRRRSSDNESGVQVGAISGQFGATVAGESEESSMLSALAADPTDLNAHLNVLEFYYMRRNADKFEAAAEAMYAQLPDPNAPEWQGAMLMGRDLCPTHPMFSDDSGAPATSNSAFADPFAAMPHFDSHEPKAPPIAAADVHDDFDFDLGIAPPAPVASKAPITEPAGQSFDFNLIDDTSKRGQPAPAKDELSFDFDLDNLDSADTGLQKASDISFNMPELDLGRSTAASASEPATQQMDAIKDEFVVDDAVATKIDLARAYLDMGDADGARSMLEEVISEGSDSQKAEAKKLLSEIK